MQSLSLPDETPLYENSHFGPFNAQTAGGFLNLVHGSYSEKKAFENVTQLRDDFVSAVQKEAPIPVSTYTVEGGYYSSKRLESGTIITSRNPAPWACRPRPLPHLRQNYHATADADAGAAGGGRHHNDNGGHNDDNVWTAARCG